MKIIKGKIPCAKKVVIYGPEGIGKSTFASQFPEPLFIDTEGSTKDMDVSRFEKPSSWQMLMDQIRYVKADPTVCKTLVIDTADWAEQMCVADVCARHGKKGVEDFGYGNGYVYAKEEFGRFLNALEEVVEAGIHVVLTAHAQMRKFDQPDELGSYDRWEMKLGKKTASQTTPLVKEWADMVLFANYKIWTIATDDKGKKHKAQGGARVMYTSHHPCWDAKNRYGLPDEVEFSYGSIRHIIESEDATVQSVSPAVPQTIESPTEESTRPETQGQSEGDATKEKGRFSDQFMDVPGKNEGIPVQQAIDLTPPPERRDAREDTGQAMGDMGAFPPDPRIPKALRDLMAANNVCEWDIQMVVEARGYFPADMDVWDYPKDFVDGVLVGAWPQVYGMIKEMKDKESIPFN